MVIDTITETGTDRVKAGLAQMLKGGVIMDVVTADQARIAEDAGACAVMALERVPSDIRKAGGVARMADPTKIVEIQEAVTIPVMAKCRIGHFVRRRYSKRWGSTISTSRRCSRLQMRIITSTSMGLPCRSYAAREIWARRCVVSARVRR